MAVAGAALGGRAVAACLVAAMTYSTINYHVSPVYDNGDLAGMGEYLRERIQPGDALLTQPVPWGRLYRYYLPIDRSNADSAPAQRRCGEVCPCWG